MECGIGHYTLIAGYVENLISAPALKKHWAFNTQRHNKKNRVTPKRVGHGSSFRCMSGPNYAQGCVTCAATFHLICFIVPPCTAAMFWFVTALTLFVHLLKDKSASAMRKMKYAINWEFLALVSSGFRKSNS